jgi:hypothetical protein
LNRAPIAAGDTAQALPAAGITIAVLANDSDADGDALTVSTITAPANGTAAVNPDGTVSYVSDAGFIGTDTFTYTAQDGNGGSATATVTVTVTTAPEPTPEPAPEPANRAPNAVDDTAVTASGDPIFIGVRDNDSDPDGDQFLVTAVTQPGNGSVTIVSGGAGVVYVSNAGASGPDSFTYTITDESGLTDTARVNIRFASLNRPPVAADDAVSTPGGTAVTIAVLSNDADFNGDALSLSTLGFASHGTLTSNAGLVTYTPAPGFIGTDSFVYTISDGNGGFDSATVTVTVFEVL